MAQWPPSLPDQTGKVAIVTGSNTGIGLITAQELARAGARVHLACRNQDKAAAAMATILTEVPGADLALLTVDLGSVNAIRASAQTFLATGEPLHLLVNNAGLAAPGLTADGFGMTFGVNHIGTALFTDLLLERLKKSTPARIVTVASRAHMRAKDIPFDALRRPTPTGRVFAEYCQSKLANVLWSAELGRALAGTGVTTYALHPGVVASDVWRGVWPGVRHFLKLFMVSVEDGARTSLYCATAAEIAEHTGRYYADEKERAPRNRGADQDLAGELWRRTEGWIALK